MCTWIFLLHACFENVKRLSEWRNVRLWQTELEIPLELLDDLRTRPVRIDPRQRWRLRWRRQHQLQHVSGLKPLFQFRNRSYSRDNTRNVNVKRLYKKDSDSSRRCKVKHVPRAEMRPAITMATREQSASASSSEWVVRMPLRDSCAPEDSACCGCGWPSIRVRITVHMRRRDSGSMPEVGSSNSTALVPPRRLWRNTTCD